MCPAPHILGDRTGFQGLQGRIPSGTENLIAGKVQKCQAEHLTSSECSLGGLLPSVWLNLHLLLLGGPWGKAVGRLTVSLFAS